MLQLPSVELFNCPVHSLSMQETLDHISSCIDAGEQVHHVVVNAAKLVYMQKDRQLYESVVHCDIINADGQAVVWASKILGKPLPERVAGIDLMTALVAMSAQKKYKIFLLGAKEEIVSKVADIYKEQYGPNIIAGYHNGYYSPDQEAEVALEIAVSGAHMLFVAISSPKKEIFLNQYKDLIHIPFIMGVGGSFDIIAGKTKRAPGWMQRNGLEWLYRVYQEPARMWKRYTITNTKFMFLVLKQWLTQGGKGKRIL